MRVDDRAATHDVLLRARAAAFPAGEFIGQESFVTAGEVLALGRRAGIAPGVRVLDLCCGEAGPGLHLTRELGGDYLGVDASAGSIARARERADQSGTVARFRVARVPPLPTGPFDVVLLVETMLAFRDKPALLGQVSAALRVGGRFAFTLEEGVALGPAERDHMPGSDTVWLTSLSRLRSDLDSAGLRVRWCVETSHAHRITVDALVAAYVAVGPDLATVEAQDAVSSLVTSHRLWSRWLREGRVRKFAVVAEKVRS